MLVNFAGRQIGRYTLLNEIGRGGMGRVYRATRPDTTEQFAVKVVSLLTTTDSKFEARFQREIDVIRRLSHPSILPVLDSGQDSDGTLYMSMPLVEGGTLKAYLQQNIALTPAQVYLVVSQVGSALDYAHTQGIIHRDVKPHNIMMAGKGRVVLTDFGVAAMGSTDDTASNLTTTGATLGTFAYMSPEQIAGGDLDGRTDIYALGVVAYQAMLGMLPFTGENTATILTQQLHSRPLDPKLINPEFPEVVTKVLEKSMAKDAGSRYTTGAEFTQDLSTAFASLPREVAGSLLVTQQQLMDSVGLTNDPLPTQTFSQIPLAPPLTLRQRILRALPLVLIVLALLVCVGLVVIAPLQEQLASVQSTANALASRPAVVITQMVTNEAGEQVFIMITATYDPNATAGPTPTLSNQLGGGATPTSGTTATAAPTSNNATGTASASTTGGTSGGSGTSTTPPTIGPTLPPTIPPTIGPTKTPPAVQPTQPIPPTAPSTTGGGPGTTTGGATTGGPTTGGPTTGGPTTGGPTTGGQGTGGQGTGGQGTAGQGQGGGSPP